LHVVDGVDEKQMLALVASLQSGSEHPLARAVLDAAKERSVTFDAPDSVRSVPGRGTEGDVGGHSFLLGSLRWMEELGVNMAAMAPQAQALQEQGATVSAVAARSTSGLSLLALLAFSDEPKAGAKEALATLRARGIKTVMISGDNRGAAEAMARRLGLDPDAGEVMAEVLPGDKAAQVMALKEGGHTVVMVGDGVNDAPALTAADVGMAMANPGGGGTDVAMHAAGITLMRGDPALVAAALDISGRTVSKIRQNLFWAFAYNAAGIPLAALGYLNPVLAGAAMALSSVSVMSNALLLKRWKP
jgi:Cu+-exporting ATPase